MIRSCKEGTGAGSGQEDCIVKLSSHGCRLIEQRGGRGEMAACNELQVEIFGLNLTANYTKVEKTPIKSPHAFCTTERGILQKQMFTIYRNFQINNFFPNLPIKSFLVPTS